MVFKSPYADVAIPDVGVAQMVYQHALEYGDKPAMIDGHTGRTLTYAQLYAGVRRVAGNLAKRGLRKGEVVGIYSPN
ncbi:MAG: AMP-binding protein, partial [Armatimonadota bacterium]|nr:AMP-binding protein [Armatimonadota bacterium]